MPAAALAGPAAAGRAHGPAAMPASPAPASPMNDLRFCARVFILLPPPRSTLHSGPFRSGAFRDFVDAALSNFQWALHGQCVARDTEAGGIGVFVAAWMIPARATRDHKTIQFGAARR